MRTLAIVILLAAVAWMGLGLLGTGLLIAKTPAGGTGDSAVICRYLVGFGVVERHAYGLNPSCPPLGR